MNKTILSLSFVFFFLLNTLSVVAQENTYQEVSLTDSDLNKAKLIKELKLPSEYKQGDRANLPWKLNNAELPFFRPVFQQEGASCGQAAGVGYNFTYEMNCARGTNAILPENQYPTYFAYNWMNGGYGWRGVSYFHSFDLLIACGSPSVLSYGGMYEGGPQRWMSGFENYYSSMLNKINEVYAINVTNPEGLQTLKYWLFNHLNESEYGGVASFYTGLHNLKTLAAGTPEEGKHVYVEWWPEATHALTIVGYNDSIRYDLNNDGLFTNDIDINDDDIVDMKDWEIGALIFANSYGDNWADSGFCFMMYRTLALEYGDGGIWNGQVHVLDVDENYQPELTMRVKLNYNSRENLKIIVGVNPDITENIPSNTMDFPLLNFQGGSQPLQGLPESDTLDPNIMELELDISKLLSYVEPNSSAKYFVQIVENDLVNSGDGDILYFSLVDRTGDLNEIVCNEVPMAILNNSITCLSVVAEVSFNKPQITTSELPAFSTEENYNFNLQASGGEQPYNWMLLQDYYVNTVQKDFPEISGEEIVFDNMDVGHSAINLQFPFPYYGDTLYQINVAIDGFVYFGEEDLSYPYFFGEANMIYDHKIIAPFLTDLWLAYTNYDIDDGVWVENTPDCFTVVWKTSYRYFGVLFDANISFALKLFPDGRIETYYNNFEIPSYLMWLSGVSKGDAINYTINPLIQNQNNPKGSAFCFQTNSLPKNIEISKQGLLSVSGFDENSVYRITAHVEDVRKIGDNRTFQLSSGLIFEYEISAGTDNKIDFADTVSIKLILKNISSQDFNNIGVESFIEDENFEFLKFKSNIGNILSGETVVIDNALVFTVSKYINDNYNFTLKANISNTNKNWNSIMNLTANAVSLKLVEMLVSNENNSFLDPGESATLNFVLNNLGHGNATDFDFKLLSNSNYLKVNTDNQHIDFIAVGETMILDFDVRTISWTPSGITIPCQLEVFFKGELLDSMSIDITIGRLSVLLLNLEEKTSSAEKFSQIFDTLNLYYKFSNFLPEKLSDYNSIFVCLGQLFDFHELTFSESYYLNKYLDEGGNVYIEGMHTWYDDEQFTLHNKFKINDVSTGNYFEIDSVYGVDGQLTDGIIMGYGGSMNFNNYYLEPLETAFPFLYSSKTDSACAIANQTSTYKTIGSYLSFGEMINENNPENEINYVKAILDFFEIEIQYEDINENQIVDNSPKFNYFPNPFENVINLRFYGSGEEDASFMIYDVNGRLVKSNKLPRLQKGEKFETHWDGFGENGKKLSAGIYFVKYLAGEHSSTVKIVKQ